MRLAGLAVALLAFTAVPLWAADPALDPQKTYSQEQAWQIGWPMMAGPFSNFLPLRTGVKIADDLAMARVAWSTQEKDFGTAKTGSKTFSTAADITSRLGPTPKAHPGNWAPVIVAEGKVFASSFRPAGPVHEAQVKGGLARFRLDAEDLVICLDARTGQTLWKAVEPGGLVVAGGKRGGFQVAPVYYQGKIYSMGSTGRLFAHDAATGQRLWQSDIGPAYQGANKEREAALAAIAQGKYVDPDGPGWHASLIVADGVLVVPTFASAGYSHDCGLRGIDLATGKTRWELKAAVSKYATPNVWRSGEREYVLCATIAGTLHLIDPRDGKKLWEVTGLGPNYSSLAPSASHVLVNIAPLPDPKAKRVPGFYGAYRITAEKAELAWKLPQDPKYQIPTWMDTCARQRYFFRDGMAYVSTEGTKEDPGHFLLLKEATGEVLADHVNGRSNADNITELTYLIEDRLFAREDSSHGPTHGGRHPWYQWLAAPGKVTRIDAENRLAGMDLGEFTNAYEVLMETPVVAGRMFERTVDGGLICYDLRQPENLTTWSLDFAGGTIGIDAPMPVRLWLNPDGSLYAGKDYPPEDRAAGLPYSQCRRFARWERITPADPRTDAKLAGEKLTGMIAVNNGNATWPTRLELTRAGDTVTGTWSRTVAALEKPVHAAGPVTGNGPFKERRFPTPWLTDHPWTTFGNNPEGTSSWVLQFGDLIERGTRKAGLTVCLDFDGQRVTRAAGAAYGFSQAWHEVDASKLQIANGHITGTLTVILTGDWYVTPNPATGTGYAARIDLDATAKGEALTGTYTAQLGVPYTATGKVSGKIGGK